MMLSFLKNVKFMKNTKIVPIPDVPILSRTLKTLKINVIQGNLEIKPLAGYKLFLMNLETSYLFQDHSPSIQH